LQSLSPQLLSPQLLSPRWDTFLPIGPRVATLGSCRFPLDSPPIAHQRGCGAVATVAALIGTAVAMVGGERRRYDQ